MKQKPFPRAAKKAQDQNGFTKNAASPEYMRANPRPFHMHLWATAGLLSAAAMPLAVDPDARDKVVGLVSDMTAQMMAGLAAYRNFQGGANRPQHKCVWQQGGSRLLCVADTGTPVLLVPSLINGYEVLDLDAQHSFAAFLSGQGFAPYILDWGAPGVEEKVFSIDDYITKRLYPALAQLNRPHVIGYCMGGTMAAGAVAAMDNQNQIRSLTMLAAPWDFAAGDALLPMRIQAFATAVEPVMASAGVLPVDWVQALFASVDPLFAFNKFRKFAEMKLESAEARHFVIVEDWLNNGPDLAAPAARQSLQEWYGQNQPYNGVWTLNKTVVDAARITVPLLVVAAGHDKLVPGESALAIVQQNPSAQTLMPDLGHIGMMASPRAKAAVWEPIVHWLQRTINSA